MTAGSEVTEAGMAAELTVSGLTVRFGALTALDGVDLAVRPGEVVALAGENGAGKTTLIRAVAGDVTPASGAIRLDGRAVAPDPAAAAKLGIRIVWQDLSLSDNLDIAANVMLGNERRRHLFSDVALHGDARRVLARLGIPLRDTTRPVKSLSGGQRQMVAVARAMAYDPRLLLLDEPTASLGAQESSLVERLIARLREQGTTILLSCHDAEQMFRLADRIVVLRHGRLVAEVSPSEVHPDDVVALVSGQAVDSSARRQLTRLHRLTGRLVSADPSSSLTQILSALGAALGSERLTIHLLAPGGRPPGGPPYGGPALPSPPGGPARTDRGQAPAGLILAGSLGMPAPLLDAWARLPCGPDGGPAGLAAASQQPVIEENIRAGAANGAWGGFAELARSAKVASSWSVPVLGPGGLLGVITVFRSVAGLPRRDDLDLAALYAGYAANAIERDRLLDQVTARNRVLETIREVLQTLAGPVPVADGLRIALHALRDGLGADEAALVTAAQDGTCTVRAYAAAPGTEAEAGQASTAALVTARTALGQSGPDGVARTWCAGQAGAGQAGAGQAGAGQAGAGQADAADAGRWLAVTFDAPEGRGVLLAQWADGTLPDDADGSLPDDAGSLLEDAAHSLRLALEREQALAAYQEAMALRQSQQMQHSFLRRLSHELRTPLTAITGYADSLLQTDVTWDAESRQRFLSRIAGESARLGRLVNDLLDFSAIESGIFRLQCDWCDIPLVIDAATAVLPPEAAARVAVSHSAGLPAIWADHDRLEQVFVNLLGNALSHNPDGTRVRVSARAGGSAPGTAEQGTVTIRVTDDGAGLPPELIAAAGEAARRRDPRWPEALTQGRDHRGRGSGAGLGLSIASGIVTAHGGRMELEPVPRGTCFRITLPIEKPKEEPR